MDNNELRIKLFNVIDFQLGILKCFNIFNIVNVCGEWTDFHLILDHHYDMIHNIFNFAVDKSKHSKFHPNSDSLRCKHTFFVNPI